MSIFSNNVIAANRAPRQIHLEREIEATQSVTSQRVGAALQHDRGGPIHVHNLAYNRFENELIGMIVHAILKRHIDRMMFALLVAGVTNITSAC